MDIFEAIRGRRAVRRYKTDSIPEEVIERLLEAAQWAPSWAHTQCCEVGLASKPEIKAALQQTLPSTNPTFQAMVTAPLVAVFCGRKGVSGFFKGQAATMKGDWMMFDVGLAMQNFMLAAHAEGLATVCVGLFDAQTAGEVLNVPAGVEVVAVTPVGYPEAEPRVPPRKDRSEFARWETY